MDFDLIVIGAGPSGSAAAYTAARAGLRTALVDKSRFPRDKLCGGGITGRSRRYLTEIFGRDLPDDLHLSRTDVTFALQGREMGTLHDAPALYLTMRMDFDATLVGWAFEAGAENFTGHAAKKIDTDSNQVTLDDGTKLRGRVLIGADGVNSQVAKALFGHSFDRSQIGIGLEIEASTDDLPPDQQALRIDFGAAEWGYGWVFPKLNGTTIGIGGVLSKNPDIKGAMARFVAQCGLDPDKTRFRGHFLPFGDFHKQPGKGSVLLSGDAAGLVDPITGEGIAYAMQSGALAAHSAITALGRGRPDQALEDYRKRLRPIHTALNRANMIRRLIFSPAFHGYFEQALKRSGTLRWRFMQLLAGEKEYDDILLSVVTRLPAVALRSLKTRVRSGR